MKAQRAASGEKGRSAEAIDRSRGGWTTKVHALTDVIGRSYALMMTAGNASDIKAAPALPQRAGRMRYLLADKSYDADQLRRLLQDAGAVPVVPGRRHRKRIIRYDKGRCRGRHLVKNAFCRLKDSRRVATRYDKLAAPSLSGAALATAIAIAIAIRLKTSLSIETGKATHPRLPSFRHHETRVVPSSLLIPPGAVAPELHYTSLHVTPLTFSSSSRKRLQASNC